MKPIMVNKTDFLQRLDSVRAGILRKPEILQSECLVFRNGRVYTFNGSIAFRIKSGLPKKFTAVVPAIDLLATLHKITAETMIVRKGKHEDEGAVYFAQKNEEVWVRSEDEVTLPIDQIEPPVEWVPLPAEFSEAIGVVQDCTASDPQKNLGQIHVMPKYVEASDSFQSARYRIKTTGFPPEGIMLRGDAMKLLSPLGMTKVSVTDSWVHFRNPNGLMVSVRRAAADATYPDISASFDMGDDARKTTLPSGLAEAVEKATPWSSQIADDGPGGMILLELRRGACRVTGLGITGGYRKKLILDYNDEPLSFKIGTKIIEVICKKFNEVLVNQDKLAVVAGRWKYVTSLTPPDSVGKYVEPKIEEPEPEDEE